MDIGVFLLSKQITHSADSDGLTYQTVFSIKKSRHLILNLLFQKAPLNNVNLVSHPESKELSPLVLSLHLDKFHDVHFEKSHDNTVERIIFCSHAGAEPHFHTRCTYYHQTLLDYKVAPHYLCYKNIPYHFLDTSHKIYSLLHDKILLLLFYPHF